ncbi:hypothetical protein Tco_0258556 [Tanacetum coccineum]
MWNNVAKIPSFIPKAGSVPAGIRNKSTYVPASCRNRPTFVPAGSRNRPTSVPAGRPFTAVDLEELDIKWQMAMLSVRINRFEKKAGRKMKFNNKDEV